MTKQQNHAAIEDGNRHDMLRIPRFRLISAMNVKQRRKTCLVGLAGDGDDSDRTIQLLDRSLTLHEPADNLENQNRVFFVALNGFLERSRRRQA